MRLHVLRPDDRSCHQDRESQDREGRGGKRGKDLEFFFAETQKSLITSRRRESQDSEEFGGVLGIDFEDGGRFLSWPKFHQLYHLPFPLLTTLTTQKQAHTPLNLGDALQCACALHNVPYNTLSLTTFFSCSA